MGVDDNPIAVHNTEIDIIVSTTDSYDDEILTQQATLKRLYKFQNHYHSLRISVSNIAAITGYHSHKGTLQLILYQHVYQGRLVKLLLHHDTAILNIVLVSDEQVLLNLVNIVNSTETNRIEPKVSRYSMWYNYSIKHRNGKCY